MSVGDADNRTVDLIERVAQEGYRQIALLVASNRLTEARQVADILQVVGIV